MECTGYEVDEREWDYDNPANNFCRCPECKGFLPQSFPLDKAFTCKKCGVELMTFPTVEDGEELDWIGKICKIGDKNE